MADFYIRSAKALDRVLNDECSVKAAASPHPDSGRVLAILINTLAYRSALQRALEASKVSKLEEKTFTLAPPPSKPSKPSAAKDRKPPVGKQKPPHSKAKGDYPSTTAFLLVLTHDLLFQSRGIQASKTWPPKVTLERYASTMRAALVQLQIRSGKSRIEDLRSGALYQEMTARIPRWIRINPLRATRDVVFTWLSENRYVQVEGPELEGVKEFAESTHVEGLLAFHPKATSALLKSEMYKESWVVMQDLASCFPAYILDPPAAGMVVDATSAPGNKTSHLSAVMFAKRGEEGGGERGRIDAFERDGVRFKTLLKRLNAVGAAEKSAGGGNVVAQKKDFLKTNPDDYPQVTHMLVDPSCSGSGIVNRLDFLKEDDDVEDVDPSPTTAPSDTNDTGKQSKLAKRLHQLSEFQLLMIRHALKFPALRKLVYSTCSIHAAENEAVVLKALDTAEAREAGWKLAPRSQVIPTWPVRGDREACKGRDEVAESVIRCVPGGKGGGDKPHLESCNGFFVACFVKEEVKGGSVGEGAKRKAEAVDEESDDEAEEAKNDEQAGKEDPKPGSNTAANRKKKLQKRRKKQRLAQHS